MSRRDDVSHYYNPSQLIDKIATFLFYANVVLACISIGLSGQVKHYAIVGQVLIAISYVLLTTVDDFFFWYTAESFRRKNAIESAYAIDLSGLVTDGYYNNTLTPSTTKYALNAFESVFFSKSIAKSMNAAELMKSVFAILAFLLSCMEIKNGEIVLLVAQTVFSSTFLLGSIGLLVYQMRLNSLYDDFYHEFVTVGISKIEQIRLLLADTVEYEAVKAHYKVRLSSKKFTAMNVELSRKWTEILNKVRVEECTK